MDTSGVKTLALKYQDYVIQMRREFHKHPEISGEEYHTRDILIREIRDMQIPYRLLKGTGIIAFIEGKKPGMHRMIRADIDGLQVQEEKENLNKKKVCATLAVMMPIWRSFWER